MLTDKEICFMHVPWWCRDWGMMITCDRVGWTAPPFCSTFCIWNVNCRLLVYWKCKGYVHLKCRSQCSTREPLPLQLQICQAFSPGAAHTGVHLTSSAQFTGSSICIMIPEFRCFIFPFILSLRRCQKRVTTECETNWCLHMPVIFFTIASVRWW